MSKLPLCICKLFENREKRKKKRYNSNGSNYKANVVKNRKSHTLKTTATNARTKFIHKQNGGFSTLCI